MKRRQLLFAVFATIVAAAVTASLRLPPAPSPSPAIRQLAGRIGTWRGEDRMLSDRQYALLETDNVLFRNYVNSGSGNEILVCVAVAGANRKVAHPPEICYEGQGWEVVANVRRSAGYVPGLNTVQELRIRKGRRDVLVQSWYRVGDVTTPSYLWQQWVGLKSDLLRKERVSALFRFSTPIAGGDVAGARETLQGFVAECVQRLEAIWRGGRDGARHDSKRDDS